MTRVFTLLMLSFMGTSNAQPPSPRPVTVSLLLPLSSSIREQALDVRSGALLALNAARLEFWALGVDLLEVGMSLEQWGQGR